MFRRGPGKGKSGFLYFSSIFVGIIILLVSIYGHSLLSLRSGLPDGIDRSLLVGIDQTEIKASRDEEFALVGKRPGEPADFYVRTADGAIEKKTLPLAAFYAKTNFPLVYLIIGLACIAIGFFTYILRPDDRKARIYYWLSLAFGSSLIISGEFYCLGKSGLTFGPSVLFILGYATAPPLLLYFSLAFAGSAHRGRRRFIFLPAVLVAAIQVGAFLVAFLKPSLRVFRAYNSYYALFRIYIIIYIALAIVFLYRAFRRSMDDEERAQIQWIFFGLVVGMLPFLLLYQVPVALGLKPLLTEDLSVIFFIGIPVTFFVAIVKYRLMHIQLVIKRSLVYSLLSVFIVGGYLVFIELAQKLLARWLAGRELAVTAVGVFLAALAFQPAQRRIQTYVDKAFFRQSYDYRQTVMAFNEKAREYVTRDDLLDFFRSTVMCALPMESIRVGPAKPPDDAGMDFSIPLTIEADQEAVVLSFGRKKSEARYTRDDRELLRTLTGELQSNLERLRLQEDVIYERASKEKLDELNRLKTEFISTVSHELRTPLSSIQSLAELLRSGRIKDRSKIDHYLGLMTAETARLSRFLHNILDYGKIEQRVKGYHFGTAVLQDVIRESAEVFQPLLEERGFRFDLSLPPDPVRLEVDADAIKRALINLIDNAIKYSGEEKDIAVELSPRGQDMGHPDHGPRHRHRRRRLRHIFQKFFRSPQAGLLCPEGAGLGLKIIRHIMDAHKGDIRVESKEGEGSVFTLAFPKT